MRFKQIVETTTAGSVATVAQPMMTQTRENVNVPGLKPVQQLMKGKSKKKGPYANSINEGKVNEDDLAEQDLIVIPGQGRLRRTGFVKQDLDQGEHEGHTLKNSLHTIARAASDLDKRLSVQSEFPEWVSEKIGAAKGMMVTVMDYLISSQEMQQTDQGVAEEYNQGSSEATAKQVYQYLIQKIPGFMYTAPTADVKKAISKAMSFGPQISVPDLASYAYGILKTNDLDEGEKNTSYMNKQNQDFYNKNPNFKRDDRGVKFVGNQLASIVTPTNKPGQVAKKPMTPFKTQGVAENNRPFRGVGGAFDRGDDERHDLDRPKKWHVVIDGIIQSQGFSEREDANIAGHKTLAANPNSRVTLKQKWAEDSLNELSSDLLQRAAQTATDKRNQAMEPKLHTALGGGYMNPLAQHYDDVSQKINNRAGQVRKKETIQNIASKIASPAVMRKMGMSGMAEEKIDFAKKLQKNVDKSNKAVVKTRQDIGSRIADIGAGGKEYDVKTDAAWDAAKKKVADKIDNKK